MHCKYCNSENVVKNGKMFDLQRYNCKSCNHKFYDNNSSIPRMRNNTKIIVTSLNLDYSGFSMIKVVEQIGNIFEEHLSQSTIHYWIHKYATLVKEFVDTFKPELSSKYHHDETEIKVDCEGRYFWGTIDEDTRFIVASLLQNQGQARMLSKFSDRHLKNKDHMYFSLRAHLHMMKHITKYSIQG